MLKSFRRARPRAAGFIRPLDCSGRLSRALVLGVLALIVVSLSAHVSMAGQFMYGDHMGNSVTFIDVTEASAFTPNQLYGPPNVSGDSMDFSPINFDASSAGGGLDFIDGQLIFMVMAKPGQAIANIQFDEAGDTTVAGVAGTDATYTDVSAVGTIDITHVDDVGIDEISVPINLTFIPNADGTWEYSTDGIVNQLQWTGNQFINLNDILDANFISYTRGVTKLSVNLDNMLTAQSEAQTNAFIAKKDFFVVTVNVPEPATALLAVFVLMASAVTVRSRR